jgi:predicted MPP superfamily phosphohydrolase
MLHNPSLVILKISDFYYIAFRRNKKNKAVHQIRTIEKNEDICRY